MSNVFVDADLFISAFDSNAKGRTPEAIQAAKQQFKSWLQDDSTSLFTNALVKHEVLRGVASDPNSLNYQKLISAFAEIEILDINEADADLATKLWQRIKQSNLFKPDTRSFDILHFACATNNKLAIASQNSADFRKLVSTYQAMVAPLEKK